MSNDDKYYTSRDGLKLHYRDFGSDQSGTPVICLPGLTRNCRDFATLAEDLEHRRRVLTMDFRGRGLSEYDSNWKNYHLMTYVQDACTLLDKLAIKKVIVIGTSLGGLCAMIMAAKMPQRTAGIVINDIGPEINPEGLDRIKKYAGRLPAVKSWDDAIAQTKLVHGEWLPDLSAEAWRNLARQAYRETEDGVPRLDFDPAIGRAVRAAPSSASDPWQGFEAIADMPMTLLWGVDSDLLTEEIVNKMRAHRPNLVVVPVARRGHVPLLDEPECMAAINDILKRIP